MTTIRAWALAFVVTAVLALAFVWIAGETWQSDYQISEESQDAWDDLRERAGLPPVER